MLAQTHMLLNVHLIYVRNTSAMTTTGTNTTKNLCMLCTYILAKVTLETYTYNESSTRCLSLTWPLVNKANLYVANSYQNFRQLHLVLKILLICFYKQLLCLPTIAQNIKIL